MTGFAMRESGMARKQHPCNPSCCYFCQSFVI
jgi:hypothetical protein